MKIIATRRFWVIASLTMFVSAHAYTAEEKVHTLDSLPECLSLNNTQKSTFIDPLESRTGIKLEVGYSCKVATKLTRNYRNRGEVKWTLLSNRGGDKKIWAVDTPYWGKIVVNYVEDGLHTHADALKICHRVENLSINGKEEEVLMMLPKTGFRYKVKNNPINFELLYYLNYTSIFPPSSPWPLKFWSNTHGYMHHMRLLTSLDGSTSSTVTKHKASVRCMGRAD